MSRVSGMPIKHGLDISARERPGFWAVGGFENNIISVMWDPDVQYLYKWNGEVVTEGKLMEYLRHE